MTALSVNLNKVALLRNQRDLDYPSVVDMGRIALEAGADGLTVHPRPDQRHIRFEDVQPVAALVREFAASVDYPVEFNIEGYPSEEFMALAMAAKPDQITLVPDAPGQRTSDHGWPVREQANFLPPIINYLKAAGCRISLFVDAVPDDATAAAEMGADRVELYTEPYYIGHAKGRPEPTLADFAATARAAQAAGLGVNAGHDLNLDNLGQFLAEVPDVLEVSIGHAITADALVMGMAGAVRAYLSVITGVETQAVPQDNRAASA